MRNISQLNGGSDGTRTRGLRRDRPDGTIGKSASVPTLRDPQRLSNQARVGTPPDPEMRSPRTGNAGAKSQGTKGRIEQPESTLRARIEQAITVLIDALDHLDGDPDFEPSIGGDDRELDDADHPEGEGDTSDFEPDRDGEGEAERESQWRVPDNAGVPAG